MTTPIVRFGMPRINFSHEDCQRAWESWRMNCGPSALAAVLGRTPEDVRLDCMAAGFGQKGYMSPTMMKTALAQAGARIIDESKVRGPNSNSFIDNGLCRIQWTGPWTAPGMNPRWAYGATHWITTWNVTGSWYVFDVNAGLIEYATWRDHVVRQITDTIKRADGGWFVTHAWKVTA